MVCLEFWRVLEYWIYIEYIRMDQVKFVEDSLKWFEILIGSFLNILTHNFFDDFLFELVF